MIHVMIDLETMGTKVGSAVTCIGAVAFDEATGEELEFFHERISLESAVRTGLTMDPSTVVWWMQQCDAARVECIAPDDAPHALVDTLEAFRTFLSHFSAYKVWGNSAAFDLGLLGAAYRAAETFQPWSYRAEMCYRTLKNLRPDVVAPAFEGTQHNALHDARHQAKHLVQLLKATAKPLTFFGEVIP